MHPPNPWVSSGAEQVPLNANQTVPADCVAGLANPGIVPLRGNSWTLSPSGAGEFASFVSDLVWEMPCPENMEVSCDWDTLFGM